jgi:hypothetical protein
MRKPGPAVTAYLVDAVEARLKQNFELRRKKNGAGTLKVSSSCYQ